MKPQIKETEDVEIKRMVSDYLTRQEWQKQQINGKSSHNKTKTVQRPY